MRVHRTALIEVLALVLGLFFAVGILGCHHTESQDIALPKSIKAGDVLTWEPADSRLGTLTLTIPDQLCVPNPPGGHNEYYGVYVVKVDTKVTCKVLAQPDNSGSPIQYRYRYSFDPKAVDGTPKSGSTIELMDIVGSCEGCERRKPHYPPEEPENPRPSQGTTYPGPSHEDHLKNGSSGLLESAVNIQEHVQCVGDKPAVVDDDLRPVKTISVPNGTKRVSWLPQGYGLTVNFTTPPPDQLPPCTNSVSQDNYCQINDDARTRPTYTYTYTVTHGCKSTTSDPYYLEVQGTAPVTPKR